MNKIQKGIIKAFQYCHQPINISEIELLEKHILNITNQPKDKKNFAFIITRNYCIDKMRKAKRETNEKIKQEENWHKQVLFFRTWTKTRREFEILSDTIQPQELYAPKLKILGDMIFFKRTGYVLAKEHNISRDTVYQWKKRALKKILPIASDELKKALLVKNWKKI